MQQERRGKTDFVDLLSCNPQVVIWELLQQDVQHDAIVAGPVKEVDNKADVPGACLPA